MQYSEIKDLQDFAQERLRVHQEELATRYNRQEASEEMTIQAMQQHEELYRQELREHINSLISAQDHPWLHEELIRIADGFQNQFRRRMPDRNS